MSASLLQVFEAYQKSRVSFVQAVAEAATRPQNVDVMQNAGVMQLLRPLLLDNVRPITSVEKADNADDSLLTTFQFIPPPPIFFPTH